MRALSKDLLSPGFYVALSTACQKLFLERYGLPSEPGRPPPRNDKLTELYLVTREYPLWVSYVHRVVEGVKPFESPEKFSAFVDEHSPVQISENQVKASLHISDRILLVRSLAVTMDHPLNTLEDLGNYNKCYPCCYQNPDCRGDYDDNPDSCFLKCMTTKMG